jgi:lipopolysaccharide export system protein LptA
VQKLRFLLLFLLSPSILFAQQRTKILLRSSTVANVDTKADITRVKNPVFVHDNAILTCDSANFYPSKNYFEAFQNVHINQSDTLNVYSDFLTYDGNTKKAHLSGQVRLIDKTSTLTTNVLDYDLGTRIGRYVNGGKIVNKDVNITSKNGYYFAEKKDAYFKYNVVAVTDQTIIKSDTLRYNTFTNWTYFYGPTNIKGKDDNLYTENGSYNTKTENAFFGKKNLYTQGSKTLKGDSLTYNGKLGYGKAIKNIVFMDSSDKLLLNGQLGEYYKADERVVVTQNAWFAMGTKDSILVKTRKVPDSLFLGADTLESQKVLQKTLKILKKPVIKKDNEVGSEDEEEKLLKQKEKAEAKKQLASEAQRPAETENKKDPKKKPSKKEQKLALAKAEAQAPPPLKEKVDSTKNVNTLALAKDSNQVDSVKVRGIATKAAAAKTDTLGKRAVVGKTNLQKTGTKTGGNANAKISPAKDSAAVFNPADTVQTRVIRAYHNVRVYKSNLQAKADSLFYTAADSVLRWYKNPILWAEGSQQTGDTIHVFFKNDKINSFQVLQNGFTVNVETDSTKFNQVKGKLITGFFNPEGELRNMFVDGNAESMYYNKDSKGNYDNLSQTVSSRIKFNFMNKELTDIITIKGNEGAVYPIDSLPKETTLTGFIWKPELRPVSKADIIKGKPKVKKAATPTKNTSKTSVKTLAKTGKPTVQRKTADKKPPIKQTISTSPVTGVPKTTDSIKPKAKPGG